eukprot:14494211-Alexandrium_andersonii.AAC.1
MSASLVGSEMCIRDRRGPESVLAEMGRKRQAVADLAITLDAARGLDPVSYTHLTLPTICSV